MVVQYDSNNSGGSWWLKDEDWLNLEKAGWKVDWYRNNTGFTKSDKDGKWLGALASHASKEFLSINCAIAEWEHITGQYASDEGCECCGQPHYFGEKYD